MATFVAVPYQLYSLTGSALQVGLLSICDAVPLLAFAAFGGTIADRFDRRKVVLWADIGLMAVVALLAVNAFCRLAAGVGAVRARSRRDLVLVARRAGAARDDAGARPA